MYVKERRKIIIIRELGRENMVQVFPRAGLLLCHQGARPDKVAARGTTTAAAAAAVDVDDDATFDEGSVRIMYRI